MNSHEMIQSWTALLDALGELADKVIFVGAGISIFLIDQAAVANARPTEDIDSIVDINSYSDLFEFEKQLSAKGFKRSTDHNARWLLKDLVFDVMPARPISGYLTNSWYQEAIKHIVTRDIAHGYQVKMISPPYFIATKLEAFKNRGSLQEFDGTDLEDIVILLDGLSTIQNELADADPTVKRYLKEQFRQLLKKKAFKDFVQNSLSGPRAAQRTKDVLDFMQTYSS